MDSEAHEELLQRLRDSDAPAATVAAASLAYLEHLLDIEHLHLAAYHAQAYGSFWDDRRKLAILERIWRFGLEHTAILLLHRWKLCELCHKTRNAFFREMFPRPQHQGETP